MKEGYSVESQQLAVCLRASLWTEGKRPISEWRGKTKVWFCSPETRQNPETLRFVAFMLLEAVESGSVLGVWEELQPDAGRWWMSAGSKVRGRALRPLTARQSGELLIFGAEEEIRALWAFSVGAEREDGVLTPPSQSLSLCVSATALKKNLCEQVTVWRDDCTWSEVMTLLTHTEGSVGECWVGKRQKEDFITAACESQVCLTQSVHVFTHTPT